MLRRRWGRAARRWRCRSGCVWLRARSMLHSAADVGPIVQELLGSDLTPAMRRWVLLVKGEVDRAQGNRDEARTQFEMARTMAAGHARWPATPRFRLARANYELREYPQALSDLTPLAAAPLPARPAHRGADPPEAKPRTNPAITPRPAARFRRVLSSFPMRPRRPPGPSGRRLDVAASGPVGDRPARVPRLRRGARPTARYAPDALVLAAELALGRPAICDAARELLDRIVQTLPDARREPTSRGSTAASCCVRTGDAARRQTALRDWLGRAPFPRAVRPRARRARRRHARRRRFARRAA